MELSKLPVNNKGEKIVYNMRTLERVIENNFGAFKATIFSREGNSFGETSLIIRGGAKMRFNEFTTKVELHHVQSHTAVVYIRV